MNEEVVLKDSREYIEAFQEIFTEAIRCRIRTSNAVGTELSGGLDSSGIACIAAQLLHSQSRKITSFTYGFNELSKELYSEKMDRNEEAFADEVAAFSKIDNIVKITESGYADFLEETDLALFINDGPYTLMPWHNPIKRAASRNGVNVLLSGFPGDELVTSYRKEYYLENLTSRRYDRYFIDACKEMNFQQACFLLIKIKADEWLPFLTTKRRIRKLIKDCKQNPRNFLVDNFPEKKYSQMINGPVACWPRSYRDAQKRSIEKNYVSERMELEGRNSLIYKIETRFPMADRRLLQFVLSVPATEKACPGQDRLLYRRSLKGIVPQRIIERTDKSSILQPFTFVDWISRQPDAIAWIEQFKNNKIMSYMNYDKFIQGYYLTKIDNGFVQQGTVNRQRVQGVLRWVEKKDFI